MKHLSRIIALILCVLTVFSLAACDLSEISGKDGLSAYELAVQNGFEGTLDEWLESLKGEKGDTGKRGANGIDGKDGVDGKDGRDGMNVPESVDPQLMSSFVVISEYIEPNSGKDVSKAIQDVIDANPNRTIFFPDGEYLVSEPIKTSAKYDKSVSLLLSNYAEIKATSTWKTDANTAIIMLGAAEPYNTVYKPGSNYFLQGGIINGNGRANGVSVDSGRETRIEGVSIKNAVVGLHVKRGVNSGSSDADILNVNIVGANTQNSVGVIVEGYDNTFEKMRITSVKIGFHLKVGGNFLRDIHPLVGNMSLYNGSIGFLSEGGNWFDLCYSDQFETAFKVTTTATAIFNNCYSYWWYKNSEHQGSFQVSKEIGFHFTSKFNSVIQASRINFTNGENTENAYMKVAVPGGTGTVLNPLMNSMNEDDTYKAYQIALPVVESPQ